MHQHRGPPRVCGYRIVRKSIRRQTCHPEGAPATEGSQGAELVSVRSLASSLENELFIVNGGPERVMGSSG